jgi:hypothetical protein
MNTREKFEANESRDEQFEAVQWICQVCGNPLRSGVPQLAHRIPKRESYLKRYGKEVIHHWINLVPVCSLVCNKVVDIGGKPKQVEELASIILREIACKK